LVSSSVIWSDSIAAKTGNPKSKYIFNLLLIFQSLCNCWLNACECLISHSHWTSEDKFTTDSIERRTNGLFVRNVF
jgi:hypothetical protein